MTGKESSLSLVVSIGRKWLWGGGGCRSVFNGLIALEKAASGNAVTEGKYHSEMLLATRESQRISLMGRVVSDVRYFLFSILLRVSSLSSLSVYQHHRLPPPHTPSPLPLLNITSLSSSSNAPLPPLLATRHSSATASRNHDLPARRIS